MLDHEALAAHYLKILEEQLELRGVARKLWTRS